MNIENVRKILSETDGLAFTLGMDFESTPDPDTCKATLRVDGRTSQPFGYLSGGASLALAETLAGVGSSALCPGLMCMGVNVNGNHIKAARRGTKVTATARIVHKGHRLHVWHVDIVGEDGELVSTVSVTNYIIGVQ
ncbi:PaaI family thioesterase [Xylanibacter muris]|uniref:PaaI family thioesterase n=1 Tax=Xylanibacter muris TaxID=2736290 RepID=A0ABX2ALS6_9BACT|nr:PaaI family thioesterase [Xylanibacter muris]NPD92161.1 PaaI family thioesterase [Xylanibacter muris]